MMMMSKCLNEKKKIDFNKINQITHSFDKMNNLLLNEIKNYKRTNYLKQYSPFFPNKTKLDIIENGFMYVGKKTMLLAFLGLNKHQKEHLKVNRIKGYSNKKRPQLIELMFSF
jgi:hypothetical protein